MRTWLADFPVDRDLLERTLTASDVHVLLILIGVPMLIVLCVVAYCVWEDRRHG